YEASRSEIEGRSAIVVQSKFRDLLGNHGSDRIGDEALYYVGRMYYDVRAYHDARVTFMRHREKFPDSEFAPTIQSLEQEMQRSDAEYKRWLDENRTTSTISK
ncbi:MAG: hypothetical protein AAB229_07860, partial [Candidatus Hydrogenedentota bacterium]